jgi:hypothetical protein
MVRDEMRLEGGALSAADFRLRLIIEGSRYANGIKLA